MQMIENNITNNNSETEEVTSTFQLPEDLYIPPNALRVFLEAFSGPLDLLLYLIKKQNIDILDIPIAKITEQYMNYIVLMEEMQLELAAEYLLMAAMLAEIKSRLLLPKPKTEEVVDDKDPRAELVRRLQEYERYKKTAEKIDFLPRLERDIFISSVDAPEIKKVVRLPDLELQDLLVAFSNVLKRAIMNKHHRIKLENLSVREKMSNILARLQEIKHLNFSKLFILSEGKLGVVVTFVAILELLKQGLLEVTQTDFFGEIYLKLRNDNHEYSGN